MILAHLAYLLIANTSMVETLFVITSDCPIAQRYTPEIKRIIKEYRAVSSFRFVYEDEGMTEKQIQIHHDEYKIPCLFSIDEKHAFARANKITGVPTVFIRAMKGPFLYRGRIDDSYGADFKWHPAKHRDLRNALEAIRLGKPVPVKQTKVIGCALSL